MARDVRLWGRERSAIEMTLFALLTKIYYPTSSQASFLCFCWQNMTWVSKTKSWQRRHSWHIKARKTNLNEVFEDKATSPREIPSTSFFQTFTVLTSLSRGSALRFLGLPWSRFSFVNPASVRKFLDLNWVSGIRSALTSLSRGSALRCLDLP